MVLLALLLLEYPQCSFVWARGTVIDRFLCRVGRALRKQTSCAAANVTKDDNFCDYTYSTHPELNALFATPIIGNVHPNCYPTAQTPVIGIWMVHD